MHSIPRLMLIAVILKLLVGDSWYAPSWLEPISNQYWQHCAAGQTYRGNGCRGQVDLLSWQQALTYCAQLDKSRQWRLPNRDELLAYYLRYGHRALPWRNMYWTSSSDVHNPQLAWYLIPGLNWVYSNYKELEGLGICVADGKQ